MMAIASALTSNLRSDSYNCQVESTWFRRNRSYRDQLPQLAGSASLVKLALAGFHSQLSVTVRFMIPQQYSESLKVQKGHYGTDVLLYNGKEGKNLVLV